MTNITDCQGIKLPRLIVIGVDEAVAPPFDTPIRAVPTFVSQKLDSDDVEFATNLPVRTETSSGQQLALKPVIQMIGNDGVTNRHTMSVSRADRQGVDISRRSGILSEDD